LDALLASAHELLDVHIIMKVVVLDQGVGLGILATAERHTALGMGLKGKIRLGFLPCNSEWGLPKVTKGLGIYLTGGLDQLREHDSAPLLHVEHGAHFEGLHEVVNA
jgi:hypothetical protein